MDPCYSDSTCLICCGNTHLDMDEMLSEDLQSLFEWIANSKMLINGNNLA